MIGYIYKWENKVNGKCYIGQTMNRYGYKERWSQHRYNAENSIHNNKFYNAIKKYGVDNFSKDVLEEVESNSKIELKNKLDEIEICSIQQFDSFENGYNSTLGGDFSIWNSGAAIEDVKAKSKESRARNKIYKSIEIKTNFKLPDSIDGMIDLYEEFDIRYKNYRYEYSYKVHHRSKHRHNDFGKTIGDRHMNIYSTEYLGKEYIEENMIKTDDYLIDWEYLDMFDPEHVKPLLRLDEENIVKNLPIEVLMDLFNMIEKMELDSTQRKILDMWRADKTQQDIADTIGIFQSNLKKQLDKIVKKVIYVYEQEYAENHYYLNIVKGKYKTCSKCGEIKLIQDFNIERKGVYGRKSVCKMCRKK